MSTFTDFQLEALDEVLDLLGATFTYKGASYRGVVSSVKESRTLRDGGFLEDVETIVIARVGDFATAPRDGETISFEGTTLRIDSVSRDETSYELRCVTAKK